MKAETNTRRQIKPISTYSIYLRPFSDNVCTSNVFNLGTCVGLILNGVPGGKCDQSLQALGTNPVYRRQSIGHRDNIGPVHS
jgi:hypothetical protein